MMMLLAQLIFTVLFTLPIAIQKLYSTFTQNTMKDSSRIAVENFVAQLLRILAHINCSIGFYVWVSTWFLTAVRNHFSYRFLIFGKGFRHEFVQIMIKVIRFIFGADNQFCGRTPNFMEGVSAGQVMRMKPTQTALQHSDLPWEWKKDHRHGFFFLIIRFLIL